MGGGGVSTPSVEKGKGWGLGAASVGLEPGQEFSLVPQRPKALKGILFLHS